MLYQKIIKHNGKVLALVFKKGLKANGVKFLTPNEYTLQLGLLEHSKGKILKDHMHNQKIEYNVNTTQEFLYIEKGEIKVKFFDDKWKLVHQERLSAGDFMLHISGGHGFEILKKCRLIEIKQGPYPGEKLAKLYRD
jgi:hypothetical protein